MSDLKLTLQDIDYLLSPEAIRDAAQDIFDRTEKFHTHFRYHPEKFRDCVNYVLGVIKKNYPDYNIPFHSRWGHFRAGKVDRVAKMNSQFTKLDVLEKARTQLDLVITSVLLDAGAGVDWKFFEKETQTTFARSEGLGIASLELFLSGAMSEDRKSVRVDAEGLNNLRAADIEKYFQVSSTNPLIGVEGRVLLLNNLGKALENKKIFKDQRPGNILDYLIAQHKSEIPATAILRAVLDGLGPIWPGRLSAQGINLGDVWKHSSGKLVPIHKLSQWMTYSLMEPILEAGIRVTGVEKLTGLAEYRNGGLMIDSGLLSFAHADEAQKIWGPESDLIIEWRSLTIFLLDKIGAEIQKAMGKTPEEFPLAKILEGGTWWAGRFLAQEKRAGGTPPVQIKSDGTVF
jgi:hypothetical protein